MELRSGPGRRPTRTCHFAVLLVAVSLLVVPVQAEPTDLLDAPTGLSGEYDADSHAIKLAWLPPENDTTQDFVYHVYQDGLLLADTTWTNLTADLAVGAHVFWVTATNEQGQESLPSQPLFAKRTAGTYSLGSPPSVQSAPGGGGGGGCEPIILHLDDSPPFADVVVRPECLPPLPCQDTGVIEVRAGC